MNSDPEISLLIPETDIVNPEISIVVPALNESLTIGQFVDWCLEGLQKANVKGEILIVDSSTDNTAEIALKKGARVLRTPKRGLGRAYIDAISHIRTNSIIMGDCDCTYDFREISKFVEKFRQGYEFIMGSRFKGYIEPKSMPLLHQYFGTPVTTSILNWIYSSHFSDIHCGMRGITKNALIQMKLNSQGWEYASEMVLKSVHLKLSTTEVPIRFLKDQDGRVSHHKRSGFLSPWKAGWTNLKTMFIFGADVFLYKPGITLLVLGLLLLLPLSFGPLQIGSITLSLHWMLLGLTLSVLGIQCFYLGVLASLFFDHSRQKTMKWLQVFRYNRSVTISLILGSFGLILTLPLITEYIQNDFKLPFGVQISSHLAVTGLFLMIGSFLNFTFTLVLHASSLTLGDRTIHARA